MSHDFVDESKMNFSKKKKSLKRIMDLQGGQGEGNCDRAVGRDRAALRCGPAFVRT
jgi:hypothetical protein